MYNYEKRLQYPVNIKIKSPKIAQIVISQYGGPDGEAGGRNALYVTEICNEKP